MIWNFRGIYPHKKPDIFYGQRGLSADTGNPLPSATLTATAGAVTTPGDVSITAYAVNTVGFQWQTSKDGEEWVNITGQISKKLERFYPHIAGTAGTYYYRVLCAGWLGVVPSPAVSVVVSYAVPAVTITASAEHVPNAGTVTLTASARYTDSYAWQVSRDNAEWVYLGITTPEAVIEYTPEDGGEYFYRCEAVGLGGKVHSIPVSVDVEYHPPIITIEADVTGLVSPGAVTLTASAQYTNSYSWQMSRDNASWSDIGIITPEAVISYTADEAGEFYYRCVAVGNGGTTYSESLMIEVEYHPPIISIAADVTSIESPGTVNISASAQYTASYTWQVSASGSAWSVLEGETGQSVSISYAEGASGEYTYRCIASGNGGETISNTVIISVTAPVIEEPGEEEQGEA